MMEKTFSHYKILEKLGEGGMGIVYKAQDTKLQRLVALKFLREQFVFDETSKARFLREARSASALNHLNIVTIYEIDELEGKYFIAMEYVEGSSLKDLTSQKPLQVKKALDIAIQVADALKST
ncbi:MAG: serine/threonine-protein kinase, partial [Candidatus Zixiibacteriota bacterium]